MFIGLYLYIISQVGDYSIISIQDQDYQVLTSDLELVISLLQ